LGITSTLGLTTVQGVNKVASLSQSCGAQCGQLYASRTYDTNGYPATTTDFNSNVTQMTYDANGLLDQEVDAFGTSNQRTVTTIWNVTLRVPLTQTTQDNNGNTVAYSSWAYNSFGQSTARCEADPSVAGATSYTCGSSARAPTGVRQWTYTYCTAVDGTQCPLVGLLLTATGPRTDLTQTTTYSYYLSSSVVNCGTPGAACYQPGDLRSVTDALGHVTLIASYDADGRVTRITDANGINTDTTYTPRGWVASRAVGGASTTFTYMPYGAVQTITDPDGVETTYGYDTAHRLTKIADALGNYVQYTLDAAGDKTGEQVYDSSGTLHKSLSRNYNTLGQLTQVTDGLSHAVFNASYSDSYDANGNLLHTADALGIQRKQGYDGLNRLISTIDNYNGTDTATQNTESVFAYDANDRLEGVGDPDGLNTTYTYDGLGNATAVASPDTGASTTAYDAAGNATQRTDAKGVVSNSTYDALNRRIATSYTDTTLNVAYGYDEPNSTTGCASSYPVGRLTRVIELNVTTVYCYDQRGNVTQKSQTQGTATDVTLYGYTPANRLASTVTAVGTSIQYSRDGAGRISGVTALPPGTSGAGTGNVVTAVSYLPFGPIASYTLGNGQTITRSYDANYAITDIVSPALNLHFQRDPMGNINALGNAPGANPATETYSYDPLYRLTGMNDANGNVEEAYTYSKTGDRLSKTSTGLDSGTYSYQSGTHHLASIGNAARAYDANGNTTGSVVGGNVYGFGYNGRNRMTVAQLNGGTVGTYSYNAIGQRTAKVATFPTSTTQRFIYDEYSQLLSEYGSNTRDYIWLDDLPVAVVDVTGPISTVSYVHADGLNTPRAVTDSGGTVQWKWSYAGNPFGEQQSTSTSGYTFNLRFPGQYFDAESSLVYSIARDYEPATGRYIESDPTGLRNSVGTYPYVDGNPLVAFDPDGKAKVVDPGTQVGGASTTVCDGLGGISVYLSPTITFDEMACWGDCTRAHEMVHRQQYLKANPTICANQPAFMRMGETSKLQDDADEIAAYKVQIDCLKAKLRAVSDCDKCKALLQKELEKEQNLLRGYEHEYENLPRI
jgi:RHS repeat-associated protein